MATLKDIMSLAKDLTTDRLIKIFIGTRDVPYLASQAALCNASQYFVKAIKSERMGKDNIGVLRFPGDDEDAWLLILLWIVRGVLPQSQHFWDSFGNEYELQSVLYPCWILADKYLMPVLQNALMKRLLCDLDGYAQCYPTAEQTLRDHNVRSVLGQLACEGLVEKVYGGLNDNTVADLNSLEGIPGAIAAIADAMEKFYKESDLMTRPDGKQVRQWPHREGDSETWKEFMAPE